MSDVFDLPGARIALETLRVLDKASIDFYERHISYRERDGKPRFSVGLDCSDTFWWGTADLEEVTEETFPVLIETLKDYKYGLFPLGDLYAARVRGMRPQGACYKGYDESVWHLFDACGPERETGLGNPRRPGQ